MALASASFLLLPARASEAHVLTFTNARAAAQARANAYAGQPTHIRTLFRESYGVSHLYHVQAQWETPGPFGFSELQVIGLLVRCVGPHTRLNARRACRPFAWVTDVFG